MPDAELESGGGGRVGGGPAEEAGPAGKNKDEEPPLREAGTESLPPTTRGENVEELLGPPEKEGGPDMRKEKMHACRDTTRHHTKKWNVSLLRSLSLSLPIYICVCCVWCECVYPCFPDKFNSHIQIFFMSKFPAH